MSTTRDTFDRIAPGWYNYRHRTRFPGELELLAQRWRSGKLLNVGCAHGPDLVPFRESFELHGVDISRNMLTMAQKYAVKHDLTANLIQADAVHLPYAEHSFRYAIAVATYHHVEGRDERLRALRELHRVLEPGGEAFLTVWNRWQPRFWLKRKDIQVPWRTGEDTLYRYYHLFSYSEIENLVKKTGFKVLASSPEKTYKFPLKYFSRNICLLMKKPAG